MRDLDLIDRPTAARALLDPARARVLAALATPGSATTVAKSLGETRQRVNHHVKALEAEGLVELVEERQRRGLTERILAATARTYVLSPSLLGDRAAEPEHIDRLSPRYAIAVASRIVREVGDLVQRADDAGRRLATLSIDTDIRFASADDRARFTAELGDAVATLAARYHDERSPNGRWHRMAVIAHPRPQPTSPTEHSS